MNNEISLYIHLPFCIRKCLYCDFLSFSDFSHTEKYKNALLNEITAFSTNKAVKSVFIGGGTPTAVPHNIITEIMNTIRHNFNLCHNAEITIEANPGTLTEQKTKAYLDCGINRISLGLQAWQNRLLKILGRIHTKEEFMESYKYARLFPNVNVDIMFALPNQTLEDWQETLERVTELNPEHISAYSLIIEEGTPFYDKYSYPPCDDELDRKMYYCCRDFLSKNAYDQYEISNFAKKGFESKHNLTYWQRGEYKGFGLGAASLMDNHRLKNTSNRAEYIKGVTIRENEVLSPDDCISEFMFLGLRCSRGISISEFKRLFNRDIFSVYGKQLERLKRNGLIDITEDNIRLTFKGMDLSNTVFVEFI